MQLTFSLLVTLIIIHFTQGLNDTFYEIASFILIFGVVQTIYSSIQYKLILFKYKKQSEKDAKTIKEWIDEQTKK